MVLVVCAEGCECICTVVAAEAGHRESVCKYSLLKTLVLSAVHTASEAAGPAPRGSESRTRPIMAQYDPHLGQHRSLPVRSGSAALFCSNWHSPAA